MIFAFFFGPIGAMVYKAINTLDSTFGYRNAKYLHFGWASARIDDLANLIPARISPFLIAVGSLLTGNRFGKALWIGFRDARKHKSPNSGFPEASFAGALGVRLGGPLFRKGKLDETPELGDSTVTLKRRHILTTITLMFATTLVAALVGSWVRARLERGWK